MRGWLRRLLMTLLSDDIELLIHTELVNADTRAFLDDEEVAALIDRRFVQLTDAVARASWGKD